MPTITFVGAGSTVFTRRLVWELTSYPEVVDSEIRLMDIDGKRLDYTRRFVERYVEYHKLPTRVAATTDRREALRGADFVFTCIHPGGDEAAIADFDIPEKYGISQAVADTLGPGGIFRGLRTVPHLVQIARDIEELAPEAILLQLSNPMAINTWSIFESSSVKVVGLCHGSEWMRPVFAGLLGHHTESIDGIPVEWGDIPNITYRTAGINHMAWYLSICDRGREAKDEVFAILEEEGIENLKGHGLGGLFKHDWFRVETWRRFGHYLTESSQHHSEYVPFYRKHRELVDQHCPTRTGGWKPYRERVAEQAEVYKRTVEQQIENVGKDPSPDGILPGTWTPESGAKIIRAVVTDVPFRFHGNVRNEGHITNLPNGCCVEVPCYADGFGINSTHVGDLPPQCAALCRTNINVQELVVKAALTGHKQLARQALLLDPLTSSILSPEQTWRLADEMFAVEGKWLSHLGAEA